MFFLSSGYMVCGFLVCPDAFPKKKMTVFCFSYAKNVYLSL